MYKVFRNPKIENVAGINVNHDVWKLMCPSKYNDTKKKIWFYTCSSSVISLYYYILNIFEFEYFLDMQMCYWL